MLTDYTQSLVSLISSIEAYFGLPPEHRTLGALDELLDRKYKNIVLLLFDGMGISVLEKHLAPDSFLRKHLVCPISSVFPPTTTAATTSVLTGRTPIEHGWLGWSLYFDKIDKRVNLYTNTSGGKPAAEYNVAGRFLPYETVIDKLGKLGVPAYFVSPYSEPKADGIESLFCEVSRLCAQPEPKYIYGYSPLPDYDMHDHGTAHPLIHEHLKEINARVEALCGELADSLIIVTADHGMTDTEFIFMDDYPEVKECILREPSIEGRAMSLFIKPEYKDEFPARFNAAFGNIYELIPHDEAMGLFERRNSAPAFGELYRRFPRRREKPDKHRL